MNKRILFVILMFVSLAQSIAGYGMGSFLSSFSPLKTRSLTETRADFFIESHSFFNVVNRENFEKGGLKYPVDSEEAERIEFSLISDLASISKTTRHKEDFSLQAISPELFSLIPVTALLPAPNNQDCPEAIPICQDIYFTNNSYSGTGNIPNEINPSNSCLASGERNDVWYTFTVQTSGNLSFLITPNDSTDDYDWAVYNLTNADCDDIYTTPSLMKSCNYSLTPGNTGPNGGGVSNNQGAVGSPFNAMIAVLAGQTYVINISNFSASNYGYTLDFSASTAQIYDNIPPQLQSITSTIRCGSSSISVDFTENILCNTIQNGDFIVTGPGGPYTVTSWGSVNCGSGASYDNALTVTFSPAITSTGNYQFCLTNTSGSVSDLCGNIAPPYCLIFSITGLTANLSSTNVACYGSSNGTATVNPSGGSGTYTYSWSPSGGNTANAIGLSAGTYTVTVGDGGNCTATASVIITEPPAFTATVSSFSDVTCNNLNNGSITLTVNGGVTPYTYNWSNGSTNSSLSALAAGSYQVTVTDLNGCTASATAAINQPPVFSGNAAGADVTCNGLNNGNVSVVANGGTLPYLYLWSNGSTLSINNNIPSGTFTVTVTDAGGCTFTVSQTINQPALLQLAVAGTNLSCNGDNSGSASANVNGGVPGYSFLWSNGITSSSISSSVANSYTVTVTDASGCTSTAGVVLTEPTLLQVNSNSSDATCGSSNGSASVAANGGSTPYAYLWSNGTTTSANNALTAGSYDVTVTDANGCTILVTVIVGNTAGPVASISSSTDVTCNGGSNGSAQVNVVGGIAPYSYLWSNGTTLVQSSSLAAGNYVVTVTDGSGCVSSVVVPITEPASLSYSNSITNVLCNGGNTGEISIVINGGVSPFVYAWSNGNTNATQNNLLTGSYTITITDANGCSLVMIENVTEPPLLTAIPAIVNPGCNGGSDGTASIAAGGGSSPYAYLWSNGNTLAILSGISAGSYTVTVTDNNGCTTSGGMVISDPALLQLNVNSTPAACGSLNGSATVLVNGGTPGYTVLWSNGNTTTVNNLLASGSYDVTVTDANGCSLSANAIVGSTAGPVAAIAGSTDVSCNGGNNGTASVSVNGGLPPYSYLWSNGNTSNSAGSIQAGNVSVTVTDANGCVSYATVLINEPTAILIAGSTNSVLCNGGNTGDASVVVNGGTLPYSYLWSSGSSVFSANNLVASNYTVTITDGLGCTATGLLIVTEPPVISLNASSTEADCFGNNNGSASVLANGGSGTYNYLWSGGNTNASVSGLPASTYTVIVTDGNGCTLTTTVLVDEPAMLVLNTSAVAASCGSSNGSASVLVNGGTPGYLYLWSNGVTTAINNAIPSGSYDVTVTDANACSVTTNIVVSNTAGPVANISSSTDVSCNGGSNGSASVTVNGGVLPYSFLWSNGNTGFSANNLSALNYNVTVTDGNGCIASVVIVINEPSPIQSNAATNNVLCNGTNTGDATALVNGGVLPYTYLWSTGSTTNSINNLGAGNYTFTVTDSLGCFLSTQVIITEPSAISVNSSVTNVTCNSGTDGSGSLVVNGGTLPYTYTWSNGSTLNSVANLIAGSYTTTVMDGNGCSSTASLVITEPGVIGIVGNSTPAACGSSNGSASISINGGTPGYTFIWSNGVSTAVNNFLSAGPYDVTVTDANGCTGMATVNVGNTAGPVASLSSSADVSCNGFSDGSASVTVVGGILPYNYLWSNGSTGAVVNNISAGNYAVTVTDGNGCISSVAVSINEPQAILLTLSADSVLCNGGNSGSASVVVNGGTAPYTFLWSSGSTTSAIGGLSSGIYSLTVTDANGCSLSSTSNVFEPLSITIIPSVTDPTCFGNSNGSASVLVNGGVTPYQYSWSNGDTGNITGNLVSGNYTLTVTDLNGCTSVSNVVLSQPALIIINKNTTSATCGSSNGTANALPLGGTLPYNYLWNTGSTVNALTSIPSGSYTVTVTDAQGCSVSKTINVTNSSGPVAALNSFADVSCFGGSDGSASVLVNGGVQPYSYLWSNGITTSSLSNVVAGNYLVTVTDANGCVNTLIIPINEPSTIILNDTITDVVCFGANNGNVTLNPVGGIAPYTYLWSTGNTLSMGTLMPAGTFSVTVTDGNGCTATDLFIIDQPVAIVLAVSTGNASCNGNSDGNASVVANGGTGPFSYLWTTGDTLLTAGALQAGSYTVIVTDFNGCTESATALVNEPAPMIINKSTVSATCGTSNGSATANPNGGTGPYGFLWSTGATSNTISNVPSGNYQVTVTDALGCQATRNINVPNSSGPVVNVIASGPVSCFGGSNGTVSINVSGGLLPYVFLWSNGNTTTNLNNVTAGNYTVTVTDGNGCSSTLTQTITEPPALALNVVGTDVLCFGGTDGSVSVLSNGGMVPYGYLWSNGSTSQLVNNVSTGTYIITVTDSAGCIAIDSVSIISAAAINLTTTPALVSCNGGSDGAVTVSVNGGSGPFNYLWTGGNTNTSISNLSSGSFTVTVTDNNGCTISGTSTVSEPLPISISASLIEATCGASNGSAIISVSGGNGLYTYLWSTGLTTSSISGILAGSYMVTVTDSSGCQLVDTLVITNSSGPIVVVNTIMPSCFGLADGTASLNISGGATPYSYNWSLGNTTSTIGSLVVGNYSVTVTDNNGCTAITPFVVNQPDSLVVDMLGSDVLCNNGTTGYAWVIGIGGTLPYAYLWSNGGLADSTFNLGSGLYSVTMTDANGCSGTNFISIQQPASINIIATATPAGCFGSSDGMVSLNTAGGILPYTYQWSTGNTSANLNGLVFGSYTVTVTDFNGCTAIAGASVTQPQAMQINYQVVSSTCGASNGSASVSVNGGSPGYSYLWSTGSTNTVLNSVTAGNYTLTVTDINNCKLTQIITVTDLSGPAVYLGSSQQVSCKGGSDGSATVLINGGSGPFIYSWSNGNTSASAGNLISGNYTVTVSDLNGCSNVLTVIISEPTALVALSLPVSALCFGTASGSASVNVSGGTLPYFYQWSNGSTTSNAGFVISSSYTVTVTDDHGCSASSSCYVQQPANLVLTTSSSPALCFGSATGSAQVNISGGVVPYSYNWSTGSTLFSTSALVAGIYTVTVTDGNGCSAAATQVVGQATAISIQTTSTPVLCFGDHNGSVTLNVSGGTGNYLYQWSSGGASGAVASNLYTGTYTVTVTDGNNCTLTTSASVTSPAKLLLGGTATDITCYGSNDGIAAVVPSGGVAPYSYTWNNGNTNGNINANLPPGTYTVTVTDANACTCFASIVVNEPPQLMLTASGTANICIGQSAVISSQATGGTGNYFYSWSNGSTNQTQVVAPVVTTTYTVNVTDANSCTTTKRSVNITVYPPLQVVASNGSEICFGESVAISAQANGGNGGPYTYLWNNNAGNASNIVVTPTVTTTYTVTVTDDCGTPLVQTTVTIIVHPLPVVDFTVEPNEGCMPLLAKFFNLSVTSPKAFYLWDFGDGSTDTVMEPQHIYLNQGTYDVSLRVTSEEGCVSSLTKKKAVTVNGLPDAAFTADPKKASILQPLIYFTDRSINASYWNWDFGDGSGTSVLQNPKYYYRDTGTYLVRLIVENINFCSDTVYEEIIIEQDFTLYIPNAFTPNNDGTNEIFLVRGIGVTDLQLFVFDRWGKRVFEGRSVDDGWNGRVNNTGEECQQDTYVYLVKVLDFEGKRKEFTGRVSLVR